MSLLMVTKIVSKIDNITAYNGINFKIYTMKKLTNISIPDFVLKHKKVLSNHPQKKYKTIKDLYKNKQLYNNIIKQIPTYSKSLVLIGYTKDSSKVLDFISTNYNLKEVFNKTKKTIENQEFNRFEWLNFILENKGFQKIKFFIT